MVHVLAYTTVHFRSEYLFNFDNTFEIHDDIEVLKRMGLAFGLEKGECSSENLRKAIDILPRSLEPYLKELAATTSAAKQAANNATATSVLAANG